jgi:hypothetical protein
MKLWRLPKIECLFCSIEFLPFGPPIEVERRTFAKAYGIKVRCYWELFGNMSKNLGTLCCEPPPQDGKKGGPFTH